MRGLWGPLGRPRRVEPPSFSASLGTCASLTHLQCSNGKDMGPAWRTFHNTATQRRIGKKKGTQLIASVDRKVCESSKRNGSIPRSPARPCRAMPYRVSVLGKKARGSIAGKERREGGQISKKLNRKEESILAGSSQKSFSLQGQKAHFPFHVKHIQRTYRLRHLAGLRGNFEHVWSPRPLPTLSASSLLFRQLCDLKVRIRHSSNMFLWSYMIRQAPPARLSIRRRKK
ncbi:uncharacterized protein LOC128777632 [Panthera pardus]|uniref:Uncharacterized protein LOC128777632 n=1 Tax=Panthera pardus TaxID=9691 RepID=A0A9W2VPP6_PANPR|nr:uncharacterized protein LOC128777632 [Panthera pardus]